MRYSIRRADGTVVVPGISLAEASDILERRVTDRGELGESIVHDPVSPLYVSDEINGHAGYTLYSSLDDMLARASKNSLKVRLTKETKENGPVTTAALIDIRVNPPLLSVGLTLRGITDLVAYETLLETVASLKARGVA